MLILTEKKKKTPARLAYHKLLYSQKIQSSEKWNPLCGRGRIWTHIHQAQNPCLFLPHLNDVLQKKIYSLIKVLGRNELGSAGKKAVVFLTVWRQSLFHGGKRISLSWILQWTPWEGTISFLLIGKNWDIVSRGREPNNSCSHILLQEIKINGSCAIMKWHFLEQILENSDSFRMQTTKLAQAGIEVLSALISPDYKWPGWLWDPHPSKVPCHFLPTLNLEAVAWSDANTVTKLPFSAVSLRTQYAGCGWVSRLCPSFWKRAQVFP